VSPCGGAGLADAQGEGKPAQYHVALESNPAQGRATLAYVLGKQACPSAMGRSYLTQRTAGQPKHNKFYYFYYN